jgi:SAM-dependent methyltransferase
MAGWRRKGKRVLEMYAEYGRFADVYDQLMDGVNYEGWAGYLDMLLRRFGVAHGASVLDCACGTGALTIRLQNRGYRVTGFDRSEEMLARAQENARHAGIKVPFVLQDMRTLRAHKPADAVVCACDGVNYLLSKDETDAFFKSAHASLVPGGLLLFDVSSAYKLEYVLGGRTYGEDTKKCAYLWQNTFDPETRLLEMDLTFFMADGGGKFERFTERHIQRAHKTEELLFALDQSGFEPLGVYDAFTQNEPAAACERIQFAAKRK